MYNGMVFHLTTLEIKEMIEFEETNEVMDCARQEHQASTCTYLHPTHV